MNKKNNPNFSTNCFRCAGAKKGSKLRITVFFTFFPCVHIMSNMYKTDRNGVFVNKFYVSKRLRGFSLGDCRNPGGDRLPQDLRYIYSWNQVNKLQNAISGEDSGMNAVLRRKCPV